MSEKESQDKDQVYIDIAGISDISGQANIAGGHIIHAEQGATVIIGAPAKAIGGLVALRELMQSSAEVHTAVIAFQTDFKVAHEQVNRLGDYKDLHDLLHQLQFHCYNGIVQTLIRFPDDELMLDNLMDYALTLEEIVEELKEVASRPLMPKQEVAWINDVALAKAELHQAIDMLSGELLKKVVWRLNRLLATQPARINTLLNHSARTLRLPSLIDALTRVCNNLFALNLDTNKVNAFQSCVDALDKLNQGLNLLIESHDQWQGVDVELRRIEASVDRDLTEFEMSWPDIKMKSEPLYIAYLEDWANALKKESDALDEALSISNPAKVRRGLRSYQRRVMDRFYRIDIQLKALCDDLRQIGTPLASLLEMIG